MSKGLLSDVEARAQRRRTRTRQDEWTELVGAALARAKAAEAPAEALRWMERARRMAPKDPGIALQLAGMRAGARDLEGARRLFAEVVAAYPTAASWSGLAGVLLMLGDAAGARGALEAALRCGAPGWPAVADAVAGPGGWCGLTVQGVLVTGARGVEAWLDGEACALRAGKDGYRLPEGWRGKRALEVRAGGVALLGSPLPVGAFAGVEGVVEADGAGIRGWAWHRAEPGRAPRLRVEGRHGARVVEARLDLPELRPFVRRWGFALGAAEVAALGAPVAVRGPDGRQLLGSPIEPGAEWGEAAWVDAPPATPAVGSRAAGVDVVVPVHGGMAATMACLESVLASVAKGARVIVVDDASPEPALRAALDGLARRRRIVLVRLPENRGFPGAANAGLVAAAGRDAVLLNSDTLVPPGWLERLRAAAYAAADIGTVTPLTNDAVVTGYPSPSAAAPMPDLAGTVALDALARRNGPGGAELPVGVGFCLYLRRDCLDQVGLLREDVFAQGYGEENDLCLRARRLGWRHVAARDVFVAHAGGASFGPGREALMRRNAAILERLHPGYGALVERHLAADPLLAARRRMDTRRWAAGRRDAAVVFVTHANGGGVERVVAGRAEALGAGCRAVVVRPDGAGLRVEEAGGAGFPNLVFPMPEGLGEVARLLRGDGVLRVEQHHTLGHHAAVSGLAARLGVPLEIVVHDYAAFCPRIALVSTGRRYCGEPDVAGCEACVADLGSLLEDDPPVRALLARSQAAFAGAARVVAPSADAARRIGRHFPGVAPEVEGWEPEPLPGKAPAASGPCRVVVVGAIGVEKGFEVLLGCARDARARGLPLEFVVVGFTSDDERLMAAGPVFVTGEYEEGEAVALIRAQGGRLALIPSVWPETWCFALSRAWEAGLRAAVFDLGAQAERVRRGGLGWTLPLGLGPSGVNDALLRLASEKPASQSAALKTALK